MTCYPPATLFEETANAGMGILMPVSALAPSTCNAGVTGSTPVGGSNWAGDVLNLRIVSTELLLTPVLFPVNIYPQASLAKGFHLVAMKRGPQ